MADKNKEILVSIRVALANAIKDIDRFEKEVRDTGEAGKQANSELSRTEKTVDALTAAAGAYLSLNFAKQIIMEADAWQGYANRLRNATSETGDFARVFSSLLMQSVTTGAEFGNLISLFQDMARAAPELNATNAEILEMTDNVSKLGVIGGTARASMRAGLLQFTQGLAGGVFRAEEWNSIRENLPALAKSVAEGLETTPGALRSAVLEGKVLSEDVFRALLTQTEQINREFAEMDVTLSRGGSALTTALSANLDILNESVGTTRVWGQLMQEIALRITPDSAETQLGQRVGELFKREAELLELEARIQKAISEGRTGFATDQTAELEKARNAQGFLGGNIADAGKNLFGFNEEGLQRLRDRIAGVRSELDKIRQARIDANKGKGGEDGEEKSIAVDPEVEASILKLTEKLREQAATLAGTAEATVQYRITMGDLKKATDEQKQTLLEAARALDSKKEAQKAAQEAEQNAAKDQEVVASLQQKIELLGMSERAQAQYEAVTRLSADATDEQKRAVRELAGELYDLGDALPESQLKSWQEEFRKVMDLLSLDIQRIQAEVEAGLRSEADGRRQIMSLQQEAARQLETDVLPIAQEVAAALGADGEVALKRLQNAIIELGNTSQPVIAEMEAGFEQAFSQFVFQALRNIEEVEDAFEALGQAILDVMFRIIAEAVASQLISSIFSAGASSGSTASIDASNVSTSSVSINHGGGIAGSGGGSYRKVAPAIFDAAPRYHRGGIASNEVPAVLERGEGVFTAAQMKALAPVGGMGGKVSIKVYANDEVKTKRRRNSSGDEEIEMIVGDASARDIKHGGRLAQSLETTYGLKRGGS